MQPLQEEPATALETLVAPAEEEEPNDEDQEARDATEVPDQAVVKSSSSKSALLLKKQKKQGVIEEGDLLLVPTAAAALAAHPPASITQADIQVFNVMVQQATGSPMASPRNLPALSPRPQQQQASPRVSNLATIAAAAAAKGGSPQEDEGAALEALLHQLVESVPSAPAGAAPVPSMDGLVTFKINATAAAAPKAATANPAPISFGAPAPFAAAAAPVAAAAAPPAASCDQGTPALDLANAAHERAAETVEGLVRKLVPGYGAGQQQVTAPAMPQVWIG